ncbi:MAG: hypothetical protein J0I12_07965 [Candidatus Eremiobacteraeota bacterium]|nr:hypothetical protein [Candidatus Eremiobacteraeota bacterium]
MGERGNIVVVQHPNRPEKGEGEIYLYTHFGGECLPSIVHQVLARRLRWDDEGYLTRMLFSALVDGDVQGDSGAGITSYLTDNGYPLLVLDTHKKRVSMRDAGFSDRSWTFEEFVRLDIDEDQPWLALGYDVEADE